LITELQSSLLKLKKEVTEVIADKEFT